MRGITEQEMVDWLIAADWADMSYQDALSLKAAQIEEKFRSNLGYMGNAKAIAMTESELRGETMILLIGALRSGELTYAIRNLLANFLTSVYNEDDESLARKVLGVPANGRRGRPLTDEAVRWERASAAATTS